MRPRSSVVYASGNLSKGGFCANSEDPGRVNELNPEAMVIDFGPWCADSNLQYSEGTQWLIHLQRHVPTREEIEAYKAHGTGEGQNSAYSGRFFVGGNEEDLSPNPFGWLTHEQKLERVQFVAGYTCQQMDAIFAGDPDAKCILSAGSQAHAPQNSTHAYLPMLLDALPQSYRTRLWGSCTHFYPFAWMSKPEDIYDVFRPRVLGTYLTDYRDAVAALGLTRNFLREVGLPYDVRRDLRAINYPNVVQAKCDEAGFKMWFWYAHMRYMDTPAENYFNLRDETGAITAVGDAFKAVVTQNRRAGRK